MKQENKDNTSIINIPEEKSRLATLFSVMTAIFTIVGGINDIESFFDNHSNLYMLYAAVIIAGIICSVISVFSILGEDKLNPRRINKLKLFAHIAIAAFLCIWFVTKILNLQLFAHQATFQSEDGVEFKAQKMRLDGKEYSAKLDEETDSNIYYFDLEEPQKVSISFTSDCQKEPITALYQSDLIDRYMLCDELTPSGMMIFNLNSGKYYFKVSKSSGSPEETTGKYMFSANTSENIYGEVQNSNDEYDAIEITPTGTEVFGFFARSNETDFFKFNLDTASKIELNLSKDFAEELNLYICDKDLNTIEKKADGATGINCTLNSGTYYIITSRKYNHLNSWGNYGISLSASESEFGDTFDSKGMDDAIPLTTDSSVTNGCFSQSNNEDYYTFSVDKTSKVQVHFSHEYPADSFVNLLNSDGNSLSDYINESGNLSFIVNAGIYYVQVKNGWNDADHWGIYSLSVSVEPSKYNSIESSASIDDAMILTEDGKEVVAGFNKSKQKDFFTFSLDRTSDVTIHLSSEAKTAPFLQLKNENENIISDYLNESNNLSFTLNPGKYYVQSLTNWNDADHWGIYTLSLKVAESSYDHLNDSTSTDDAIDIKIDGDEIYGSTTSSNDVDFYTFTLDKSKDVSIKCSSKTKYAPIVELYDEDNVEIKDYQEENDSRTYSLEKGTYFIKVKRGSFNNHEYWGVYSLSVKE